MTDVEKFDELIASPAAKWWAMFARSRSLLKTRRTVSWNWAAPFVGRGFLHRKMYVIGAAALAVLSVSSAAANAVSVTKTGNLSDQYSVTKLLTGPNGCLWAGLSLRDRNDPNYALNTKAGAQDYPFATFGPDACSGRVNNTANLGSNIPRDVTYGPDGAMWFSLVGTSGSTPPTIARATSNSNGSGQTTNVYQISSDTSVSIMAVATGADGNIWYATNKSRVGKMSTSGQVIQEYDIGYQAVLGYGGVGVNIGMMTLGPDNNIWMIGRSNSTGNVSFVKITTSGVATGYPIPPVPGTQLAQNPVAITSGPDGALWYVATNDLKNPTTGTVGRLTTSGAATSWTVTGQPSAITAGPDGAVWFTTVPDRIVKSDAGIITNVITGNIDRITSDGTLTEYTAFTEGAGYYDTLYMPGIGTGADGKIYALRFNIRLNNDGVAGYIPRETDVYVLTPDAAGSASDPSVTVVTSGDGQGVVKMSVGKNPANNQSLITLTATPTGNATFGGWSEPSCSGNNLTCQVAVTGNKTVTATFSIPSAAKATAYQGAIFSAANRKSFIRFYAATHGGIVFANLLDPTSGQIVGSKEVPVSNSGMAQVGIDELMPSTLATSPDKPDHFTVSLQANFAFAGYFQHVLWDPIGGSLSNLTACDTPLNNAAALSFVDSSVLAGGNYNSSIVVTNPTSTDISTASLDIFDANGTQLGSYVSGRISAKGSKIIPVLELEQKSGIRPDAAFPQYLVKPKAPFIGTLQHLVVNQQAGGLVTDLTTSCPLSGQ